MGFDVRRVVTGHDDAGRSVFVSDGTPPRTIDAPNGYGVSDLLYVGGPPASAFDVGDPPDGPWALEPPPGGCTVRLIRIPPPAADAPEADRWIRVDIEDPDRPGMHTTDTLDFEVIVDGSIVLGLDDGEHELHAGDVVVQRGTAHRWRVTGDRPCTYAAFMFRTDPDAPRPAVELATRTDGAGAGVGPRRLVTATGPDGRSSAVADGPAPLAFQPDGPGGLAIVDLWQTGGRLARPDQGGDSPGPYELDPAGGGIAYRYVEWPPGDDLGTEGWHTTTSIDLDLVLDGEIELAVSDDEPVILRARRRRGRARARTTSGVRSATAR